LWIAPRWARRIEFKDLLDELQPGDVLITVEGSRIARNVRKMSQIYEDEFEDRGIELLALNEQWDTTTAMGKAGMQMTWVWAEAESNQISERVSYAKETSRDLGHWQGGIAPLGLDYDERPGYLVVNEIEAEVVRAIFKAVAAGISYNSIAMCLNNWKFRGPNKGQLNAASIYRIVRNPVYIGCGEWQGELFDLVGVAPIIERETWDDVQTKITERAATSKGTPKQKYLLSGLLTCGKCRSTMIRRVRYGRETTRNKPGCPASISFVMIWLGSPLYTKMSLSSPRERPSSSDSIFCSPSVKDLVGTDDRATVVSSFKFSVSVLNCSVFCSKSSKENVLPTSSSSRFLTASGFCSYHPGGTPSITPELKRSW
jgi:site-specific DNA recombinase